MSSVEELETRIKQIYEEQDYAFKRMVECARRDKIKESREWNEEYIESVEERKYSEQRLIKLGGKPKSYHAY